MDLHENAEHSVDHRENCAITGSDAWKVKMKEGNSTRRREHRAGRSAVRKMSYRVTRNVSRVTWGNPSRKRVTWRDINDKRYSRPFFLPRFFPPPRPAAGQYGIVGAREDKRDPLVQLIDSNWNEGSRNDPRRAIRLPFEFYPRIATTYLDRNRPEGFESSNVIIPRRDARGNSYTRSLNPFLHTAERSNSIFDTIFCAMRLDTRYRNKPVPSVGSRIISMQWRQREGSTIDRYLIGTSLETDERM